MKKNVIQRSLFPTVVPDTVEVWQGGGGKKTKKMRDRSKYKCCENCLYRLSCLRLAQWRTSERKTFNPPLKLMRGTMLN